MPWSTNELAELAGTTLNTVRHYHRVGLLDEPERRYNGYKQYDISHLVRLLRIRRLVALGIPLGEIPGVLSSDELPAEVLETVDDTLRTKIEHLTQAREEIASILRNQAPADAPAGFAPVASRLSDADRSMVHLYSQVYDEATLTDIRDMTEADDLDLAAEIDNLPADADEETRQRLIDGLAPVLAQNLAAYPWLRDPGSRLPQGRESGSAEVFVEALVELYNPAQLDVFVRASALAKERVLTLQ
ncbi:MerR family transcriptional regulator [Microbacterium paludicola]|uniref:MerR family transcriptional regulator n=1 Tax=Microbacterium paludicola TaxID=300019 RepID=UPI0011A432F5|nr:MerR family transcriptional regulator [Microbacterium paludicola]